MVKDQLLNGFLQSINVQPNMHQDFSVLTDTCRNSKMDLLEHSPNAINSWNPSKAEQVLCADLSFLVGHIFPPYIRTRPLFI